MNIFDKELHSDRLKLRKLRHSDLEDMFEYTSQTQTTKYLEWDAHKDISETKRFIESAVRDIDTQNKAFIWGVELKLDSKLIGVVRIYDYSIKDKRAEISYILNNKYAGKGFMTEAIFALYKFCFTELGMNRIQAKCSILNIGSERIMQKTGMVKEGLMRKYSYIKGEFHDVLLYAITYSGYIENQNFISR